ncbi:MAG: DUF805 domain-containing protein, partial [Thermomicrobiales bacterium]|nr:DUF805 domain-containing protein [Thermomicrobiales bacterium]
LLSAHGRIGRKDYWIAGVLMPAILIALLVWLTSANNEPTPQVSNYSRAQSQIERNESSLVTDIAALVTLIALVPVIIAGWTNGIKRLHDLNRSGWWMLAGFVPFMGLFLALGLLFISGSEENNHYGPPDAGSPFPRLHT